MAKGKSGGAATAALRQQRWRERIAEQGERRVCLVVPAARVGEIKEIARKMRAEGDPPK